MRHSHRRVSLKFEYLGEIKTEFENSFTYLSGAHMGWYHEEQKGWKSCDTLPLTGQFFCFFCRWLTRSSTPSRSRWTSCTAVLMPPPTSGQTESSPPPSGHHLCHPHFLLVGGKYNLTSYWPAERFCSLLIGRRKNKITSLLASGKILHTSYWSAEE